MTASGLVFAVATHPYLIAIRTRYPFSLDGAWIFSNHVAVSI
jgi:hypothetical protein